MFSVELQECVSGCADGFVPGSGDSAKDLGSCSLVPPSRNASRMREVTKDRQKRPPLYKEGYIRKALQQWWKALGATAILDALGKRLDLVVGIALFSHLFADLAIRVNDGGVVLAAELFTDLGKG